MFTSKVSNFISICRETPFLFQKTCSSCPFQCVSETLEYPGSVYLYNHCGIRAWLVSILDGWGRWPCVFPSSLRNFLTSKAVTNQFPFPRPKCVPRFLAEDFPEYLFHRLRMPNSDFVVVLGMLAFLRHRESSLPLLCSIAACLS